MNRIRFNTTRFNNIHKVVLVSPFPLYVTLGILQDYGIQVAEISDYHLVVTNYKDYYVEIIEG